MGFGVEVGYFGVYMTYALHHLDKKIQLLYSNQQHEKVSSTTFIGKSISSRVFSTKSFFFNLARHLKPSGKEE
jgi:hypothetical protein